MRSAHSTRPRPATTAGQPFSIGIVGIALTAAIAAGCGASSSTTPQTQDSNAVTDDFERATLGPNWIQEFDQTGGIVGGKDFGALAPGFLILDWVTHFGADQFSEVVIAAARQPNTLVQVHLRRQSDTFARYGFHWNPEKSPGVWEIKFDGVPTAQTRILASTTGPALANGDVMRIEARGREISGFLNGQRLLVATDNAPNAILGTGGTGFTSRPVSGTSTSFPTPIVASWKGGTLK